jgi:serine/threonine protein kinase
LHHPHLIHVEKVWFQPGYICIAMELADGTLHDLLSVYQRECGTAMFPDQVCTYLFQAAEAIDFLNTRQHQLDGQKFAFQHCDIKPSNIMVIGDSIKISDFGLATPMASTRARRPLSGTIDFSPPEFSHGEVSNRSDQYSLAVTYCLLRGGRLPFKNLPSKFDPTFVRPTPDLMMLTETERSVIARALSVSPPNRWPNCVDMIIELSSALGVALPISALTSQSGRLSPR